ncbi:hypothetical protein CA13_29970 [Planctomycetes bacterium CA13]|uniref:Uncharacterized protein n=1 Tax=Novipirellula herctigrandis TaxID=2527986 RepID=A0A5C5Z2P7_9BACT|nr:hypothetical protein CA13_29970 [Planctomycetes bacterium CA13]
MVAWGMPRGNKPQACFFKEPPRFGWLSLHSPNISEHSNKKAGNKYRLHQDSFEVNLRSSGGDAMQLQRQSMPGIRDPLAQERHWRIL